MTTDWHALQTGAVTHLQALLRLETTNPPGNETLAAQYLAQALATEGIDATILERVPGRGNLVARLRAPNPTARPILLMGHTDVVSVERDRWSRDPFGGEIADGFIWGRGALDMKGQVAAELATMLALKRSNAALNRDVIFAAFADEEAGGAAGAAWMWDHHRDLLDAEFAINEGGGDLLPVNGHRFYLCQAGEKGASRLRITARGKPGHASIPLDDTAMKRLGQALVRLHAWQPATVLTRPVRQLLETIAPALGPDAAQAVQRILTAPSWDDLARLPLGAEHLLALRATTRNTAVPTIVHGGHRINVIPSEAVLEVDGRILPGVDPDEWRAEVQAAVGDEVEVTLTSRQSGIEADPASPFFDAIRDTIAAMDPGAGVAPFLVSGGTDARHLPGIKVYGFFPLGPVDRSDLYGPLVHGHDERIAVEDLGFATRFLYELVTRFCGAP